MGIEVDLGALLQELASAREQTTKWPAQALEILRSEGSDSEREAKLGDLMSECYRRLVSARVPLVALHRYLPALLGPPPPLPEDMRELFGEAERTHAAVDEASRELGRSIGYLEADPSNPELRKRFDVARARHECAQAQRRKLMSDLLGNLEDELGAVPDAL